MRLPSLMKVPRHKRFEYQPRYYDEAAEELRERVEQIRREVAREQRAFDGLPPDLEADREVTRARIASSFRARRRPAPRADRSSLMLLLLVLIIGGGLVGYLYYGNVALVAATVAMGGYVILQRRLST